MAILQTGLGRAFITLENGCGTPYLYQGSVKVDGLDKSFGEPSPIYRPSALARNQFDEESSVDGAESRWTSTLTNTMRFDTVSELERASISKCPFTLQVHYGTCNTPTDFLNWDNLMLLTDVRLTNYGLSTLTATTPEERAAITETAGISIGDVVRLRNLDYTQSTVTAFNIQSSTNEVITTWTVTNIVYAGGNSCGTECSSITNTGCDTLFTLMHPSTTGGFFSIIYTFNGGRTWFKSITNIPHNSGAQTRTLQVVGSTVYAHINTTATLESKLYSFDLNVLESLGAGGLNATLLETFTPGMDIMFTTLEDIYVLGPSGAVKYRPISGGTFQTASTPTTASSGTYLGWYDSDTTLVGHIDGSLALSTTKGLFASIPSPTTQNIQGIEMFTPNSFLISSPQGVWCTNDRGINWHKTLNNSGNNAIRLQSYKNTLVYAADLTRIYRSTDGGGTWSTRHIFPGNNIIRSIEICDYNPNNIVISASQGPIFGR